MSNSWKFFIASITLLILVGLFGCGGGYIGYNVPECSSKATDMTERIIMREYEMLSNETQVCYFGGIKYHYIDDTETEGMQCDFMPYVVNVECFSNCLTQYYSCFIFHSDGYVVEDVRKFGEERIRAN